MAAYAMIRRTRRWYMNLFWDLFNAVITNSFILWSSRNEREAEKRAAHLHFRLALAEELAGDTVWRSKMGRPVEPHAGDPNNRTGHYPTKSDLPRVCTECGDRRVMWQCVKCGVHLCIEGCFEAHMRKFGL